MLAFYSELSGHILICLYLIYTLACLDGFINLFRKEKKMSGLIMSICNLGVCFVGFTKLQIESGSGDYGIMGISLSFLLLLILLVSRYFYKAGCQLLMNTVCMLFTTGLIMISRVSMTKASKQLVIAAVSVIGCLFIPWIVKKSRFFKSLKWAYPLAGLGLLLAVFLLAKVTHGSKLSVTTPAINLAGHSLGGITFQPSEFVKLSFVIFLAAFLWKDHSFKQICLTTVLAGAHVAVLAMSNDLGSAFIYFVTFVLIVCLLSGKMIYLILGAGGGTAAAIFAYQLFSHVKVRVRAWQDPFLYIEKEGYQICQSLFAIGTGGFDGVGLRRGNPKTIPFVEDDFIFSAICEEMGCIIGICVIVICLINLICLVRLASRIADLFYQTVVYGIACVWGVQIFLTIGGGTKFIPLTGVTLPFISYGGSSVMASFIMLYVVQGIVLKLEQREEVVLPNNRKPLFFTGIGLIGLYIAMIAHLITFCLQGKEVFISNPYNSRQKLFAQRYVRGTIYDAQEHVIASGTVEGRTYPYHNLFAHILGYADNGRMGVEDLANYYLSYPHVSIWKKASNAASGLKTEGDNVYTTLDLQIQQVSDEALGKANGAVIVTEVKTGKILAMVSHPDFDPNRISVIWEDLMKEEEEEDSDGVLVNRATQGLYPPGSTFKTITALTYLRQNGVDSEYSFDCNGYFDYKNYRINCYHQKAHGSLDLMNSFAQSCNSSFANIGVGLNRKTFQEMTDAFLFGQTLPIDLPSAVGKIDIPSEDNPEGMLQDAIGQGKTQMSPMQIHLVTSTIANNGVMLKPYVIDRICNAYGKNVKQYSTVTLGRIIKKEEASTMQRMMEEVVNTGTAKRLNKKEYTCAGKTGSAEYDASKGHSHAWFTGYMPAEDPKICVTVLVEDGGTGSESAVPIAEKIFDAYVNK